MLSSEGPSWRHKTDGDDANTEFLTVVLEEGRHLTHPDLLVGPLELFAEMTVDFQLERGRRDHSSCDVGDIGHSRTGCRVLRSNM